MITARKKAVGLLLALLVILTACSHTPPPRQALSPDDFVTAAKGLSWDTVDLTDAYADQVYVVSVIMATQKLSEADFFTLVSDDLAGSVYDSNLANIQQFEVVPATHGYGAADGYRMYWVKTPNDYWTVIQVGETVLFCHAPISQADLIDQLIAAMKY